MAQIVMFLTIALPYTTGFDATICNCTDPTSTGVIQFSDSSCETIIRRPDESPLKYAIYTEQREAVHFPAFVCARWKQRKTITMNFLGQLIVVPDKLAIETAATECKIMQQTLHCGDNLMIASNKKWTFTEEPDETGYWLRTIVSFTLNCVLEEITLDQKKDTDNVVTPLGTVNGSDGTVSHNHMTIIWDSRFTTPTPHKHHLLETGVGYLTFLKHHQPNGTFRLMDIEKQLDFHVVSNPRCITPLPDCVVNKNTYDIIGDENIYLMIKNSTAPPTANIRSNNELGNNVRAEIQFIRDQLTDNENNLAGLANNIQCDVRKLIHSQAVSTAQYNGWLAAAQLNLPRCTKLVAVGRAAILKQCKATTVDFQPEMTSCGPQPRFENYTINLDGWELVHFLPCYWTTGFVNFNGKPHGYRNGTWVAIEATIILPTRDLADSFRYEDVRHLSYEHDTNPSYTNKATSHMDIMADIAAVINEQAAGNSSGHHTSQTTSILSSVTDKLGFTTLSTWFEKFKIFIVVLCSALVVFAVARACYAIGLCKCLWILCCKPSTQENASQIANQQSVEMRDLQPLMTAVLRAQANHN